MVRRSNTQFMRPFCTRLRVHSTGTKILVEGQQPDSTELYLLVASRVSPQSPIRACLLVCCTQAQSGFPLNEPFEPIMLKALDFGLAPRLLKHLVSEMHPSMKVASQRRAVSIDACSKYCQITLDSRIRQNTTGSRMQMPNVPQESEH